MDEAEGGGLHRGSDRNKEKECPWTLAADEPTQGVAWPLKGRGAVGKGWRNMRRDFAGRISDAAKTSLFETVLIEGKASSAFARLRRSPLPLLEGHRATPRGGDEGRAETQRAELPGRGLDCGGDGIAVFDAARDDSRRGVFPPFERAAFSVLSHGREAYAVALS